MAKSSVIAAALFAASVTVSAQPPAPRTAATGVISKPVARTFAPDVLKRLFVPQGFHVTVFATELGRPRMMTVGSDGTVYVTCWETNDVIALRATEGARAGA